MNSVRPLVRTAVGLQQPTSTSLHAIDFGVGSGTETGYLLAAGYTVYAIDNFEEFLSELSLHEANTTYLKNLSTVLTNFEEVPWETIPQVDLFVASHSLYFIQPDQFHNVWKQICDHIIPGGLFAGEFSTHQIANRQVDGYFIDEKLALIPFMTESHIRDLLSPFEIVQFSLTSSLYETNNETSTEEVLYSVIARKK